MSPTHTNACATGNVGCPHTYVHHTLNAAAVSPSLVSLVAAVVVVAAACGCLWLLVGVLQLHKYVYLLGITCFICGLLTLVTLVLSHPGLPRFVSDAIRCDSIRFGSICLSVYVLVRHALCSSRAMMRV